MKHSVRLKLLTVVLVLSCLGARAGNITEGEARTIAWNFLQSQKPFSAAPSLNRAGTPVELNRSDAGQSSLYVFNVGDQDGFVIVSGDDRTRSILGYADSGSFDADKAPEALRQMLSIYANQIQQLRQGSEGSNSYFFSPNRISGNMGDVNPLLSTSWSQDAPYNAYCPIVDDQTALTGCVATAMAQIAKYHRYPTEEVPSLAAYTTSTNKINVSAWSATTFDWGNMLDTYNDGYDSTEQTAIATLMRYCGQAAKMDYGLSSSASNGDALYAFKEKLGYNPNAEIRKAADYSPEAWERLIHKELSENRPVYYSALDGEEGCDVGGHTFVIDGYRADGDYFHVNWGWNGLCNGYFNLFALDAFSPESEPTTTGYHYQMLAIIGLSPENIATTNLKMDASGNYLITNDEDWNELATNLNVYRGESFKLTADINVTKMVGTPEEPFSGTFDGQGHTLNVNIESDKEYTAPFHWVIGANFNNLTVSGKITVTEHFAGGLIGWAEDVVLQNCESKVTIHSNYGGDGTHGGFISIVRGGEARFYDCVFSGAIIGENTDCCGGFCGWRDGGVEVYNSLFLGRFELSSGNGCATFSRNGIAGDNCYYDPSLAKNIADKQGTEVSSEELADGSITHKLQNGTRDWTSALVWGQTLGTDPTPVLTSDNNKRVNKVSFVLYGKVVKTILTNNTLGDKMPKGEDFGIANASFTCNGTTFTSSTPINGDITVDINGSWSYSLTVAPTTNGKISINNTECLPGTLKKVTAVPNENYVVNAVKVVDGAGNPLPLTQVSNCADEYVFVFPNSSVTVSAEFVPGEREAVRFINGGMNLPSSWRDEDQHWSADTWMIWGEPYDNIPDIIVGTPPTDAFGNKWYEENYTLTNSDSAVLPNGNKIVWENHQAPFRQEGYYDYFVATGAPVPDNYTGDFYIRRIFTFKTNTFPSKLYLSCSYDDSPAEYYINGTLVFEDHRSLSWVDGCKEIELTPEQIALIHTDGTPNVMAVHVSQNWGGYHLDCGLYDPTAINYEVIGDTNCRVLHNAFMMGDVEIPQTITYGGKTYTVTELVDEAFYDCYDLTSVTLPETIDRVGEHVFGNCHSLQYVKSYVTVYRDHTLLAAPVKATEFELPMEYTSIYRNAFKFTESLKKLTLPRSLADIGENAFSGCKSLNEIYTYSMEAPSTEGNAFDGLNKGAITVHVYQSALESFKQAWGEEFKYVTMPDPEMIRMLTIEVTEAGSLQSLIDEATAKLNATAYDVQGITVTGNINNDDLRTIAAMCTGVYSLSTINLSEANVEGNSIDDWVFADKEKLTSIILPQTLEYINESSFRHCEGLTSIDIPASVKRIWSYAFADCYNLSTVTGLEGISAEDSFYAWDVFGGTTAITEPVYGGKVFFLMPPSITGEYEVPAGITMTIGGSMRNSQLSTIILPASITALGDDTFQDCHNMTDIYCYAIEPPYCHSWVWEWGFDRSACTVHVPATAVEAYKNADDWREFERIVGIVVGDLVDFTINVDKAGSLNQEKFDSAVSASGISDKVLIKSLKVTGNINLWDVEYLNTLPATLYNLAELNLSETSLEGNTITEGLFAGTLYKSIQLPKNINTIEADAFRSSRRLSQVTIPNGVTRIESAAFNGCSSLSNIVLPESLEYLGSYAFAGSGLMSITIPDNVTEMGDRGLQGCDRLTSITIGNGMTYVPDCWAEYCHQLQEVTIGKNMKSLRWRVFYGGNIQNVYCYAKNAPSWDDSFYEGINSEAVLHVHENRISRYQKANGWREFAKIVGDLGTYPTFEITVNVAVPGTIGEAIAKAMISIGCESIGDITALKVIGNLNNSDLAYIRENMGASLDGLDLGAVAMENNNFEGRELNWCGFERLILPENIHSLGDWYCLESLENLKTIHIPSSVRHMPPGAFNRCYSLESVTGGDGITEYDHEADAFFPYCTSLKGAVILNSVLFRLSESTVGVYEVAEDVTTIAQEAMSRVEGLTSLTLQENITHIWRDAFWEDHNLRDITFYTREVPHTHVCAFNEFDRSSCTLHVYEEMVEVFKADELWGEFNIVGDLGAMPNLDPMVESDYADLCAIYETLGGQNWLTKWVPNKNVQTASRWRGVTFDPEGYVVEINLEGNNLQGDISTLSLNGLTRLKSLDLHYNSITGDLQTLISSLPKGCKLNVMEQDLGNQGEHTLYELCRYSALPKIAYYNSDSQTFVSTLMGLDGMCQFVHKAEDGNNDWEGFIWADGGTRKNNEFLWASPVTLQCQYPHRFTFTYTYRMGDANMDDALNVLDLQSTLNYSNGDNGALFNLYAADTYGQDRQINVQDIVATVNILLALDQNTQSRASQARVLDMMNMPSSSAEAEVAQACVCVEDGQIVLYSTKAVAALDLHINGISPEKLNWNTEAMGFATACVESSQGSHAIIYSFARRQIEEGRTVLATFEPQQGAQISSVVLSDADAHSISVGTNVTTGISTSTYQEGDQNSCYSLDGIKREASDNLPMGIYIINGKKTIIK